MIEVQDCAMRVPVPVGFAMIPGTQAYAVSAQGHIKKWKQGAWASVSVRPNAKGYLFFFICEANTVKKLTVHRAVLLAHVGPAPNNKSVCRHLDGNKLNNEVSNLVWGTPKENSLDRIAHGTQALCNANPKPCPGSANGNAVLTELQVEVMRVAAAAGYPADNLAQAFSISTVNAAEIIARRRWQHVQATAAEAQAKANAEKAAEYDATRAVMSGLFADKPLQDAVAMRISELVFGLDLSSPSGEKVRQYESTRDLLAGNFAEFPLDVAVSHWYMKAVRRAETAEAKLRAMGVIDAN